MKVMDRNYWTSEMNKMNRWLHAHPIKACVFTALFLFCSVLWEEWCWQAGLVAAVIGYAAWLFVIYTDLKKLVGVALAVALFFNPPSLRAAEPPQKWPLVCVAVVVFLIIGGVVVRKIAKKGGNIAKGRTNAWPEELNFVVAGAYPEYGACFSYGEPGYCPEERSLPRTPTVFTLNITVNSASNATVTMKADVGFQFIETFSEFTEKMQQRGLTIGSGIGRTESFSRNNHPVFPEQVPIVYNWDTKTATIGPGGILVTVERSSDLQTWEPFMKINVEAGSKLECPDVGYEKAFYRATTKEP